MITTLLSFSIRWMLKTWANLSTAELVYHLKAPIEGTNTDMIKEYLQMCLFPSVLITISILVITYLLYKFKKKCWKFLTGSMIIAFVICLLWIAKAWIKLDISSYISGQMNESQFIDTYYVDPRETTISFPEKKKNLIYIFLESMEMTYADKDNGGAFEKNVIPELTKLAQENEDFSGNSNKLNGGYSTQGATWTMGGMFAQVSGIPLNISIDGNNMDTQESFFPGITTLGDILDEAGYSQTLLLGSDAVFGGRELYFTQHGRYNIEDYNYARDNGLIPKDYQVWWGYEDQKLFSFAKDKLQELSKTDKPFNLTMLTVDTHFEDGYVCELCGNEFGENQYANVMACSSRQVSEFVEWVRQQDFYEDTVIVISGDHPTMDSDFCENIDQNYERRVYTAYINAGKAKSDKERDYTTFDAFPTTLAALGVQIEGNRLGLGTNLFSTEKTLTEIFGIEKENSELKHRSKLLDQLADVDEESEILKERENNTYSATIALGNYQHGSRSLPVRLFNIKGNQDPVEKIQLAVWKEEDQNDLQWIDMQRQMDGSYFNEVIFLENQKAGKYNIYAYAQKKDGEKVILARQKKYIASSSLGNF